MTFLTCLPTLDPSQHPVDRCPSTRDVSRGWNPSVRMLTPPRNWGRSYPWIAHDTRTVTVRACSAHRQRHPLLFDVEPSPVCSNPSSPSIDGPRRRLRLFIPPHMPTLCPPPVAPAILSRFLLACTLELAPKTSATRPPHLRFSATVPVAACDNYWDLQGTSRSMNARGVRS